MIEEPEPVRAAMDHYQPAEDEDIQPLVQIAFYEGFIRKRGFDWLLSRYGLCSAITTVGGATCRTRRRPATTSSAPWSGPCTRSCAAG